MTRVLAIDPATVTGVADGYAGGAPTLTRWVLRTDVDDEPHDLFKRAARHMWLRVSLEKPDILAIETPVPPHRAKGVTQYKTTLITLGLYGLYVGIASAAGVRVVPAHISTWRKAVLGKGNMRGEDAKRAAVKLCRQLGWACDGHDDAEAACIFIWACGDAARAEILRRAA